MYVNLYGAVTALLQQCDGAVTRDGAGFNKFDTTYARWLVSRYPDWSGASAHQAWNMLRKYQGQLHGLGIDWQQLPIPDPAAPRPMNPARPVIPRAIRHLDNGTLAVSFPYDAALVTDVKQIKGARFNGVTKCWAIELSTVTIGPLMELATRGGFDLDADTQEVIRRHVEQMEQSKQASKATDSEIAVEGLGGTLRPFQRAGVAYTIDRKRTFIADEMGLGKTVQALAAVQGAGSFPCLVVVPASVKHSWEREANKWLPGRSVAVLNGGKATFPRGVDCVIINYDLLRKWSPVLEQQPWKSIIFDESHYLKNKKAQRTQAAKTLADKIPMRLALTGTPVLNRPVELVSQLDILGRLPEFGGWWYFVRRYCGARRGRFGLDTSGATNLPELNERLRSTCYIRRSKAEVLPELPAKIRTTIELELSNREEYDEAERNIIGWLRNKATEDAEFLASIAGLSEEEQDRLRRQRGADAVEKAKRAEQLVRIEALKQCAVKGKMEAVREWITNFLESDAKLIVFAHHRDAQAELLTLFPGAVRVHGDDDAKARQAAVDRFQDDPACRLIVCSLAAGGVGITLTAASNVAFVEFGWNPSVHDQAEDRCHRIGQHDSVTAWWLVGKDTIDEEITALIEEKRTTIDAAVDGAGSVGQESMLKELVAKLMRKGGD